MSWYQKAQIENSECQLDVLSVDNFRSSISRLKRSNPDAFQKLADKFEELKAQKNAPTKNKTVLYHGTSAKRKQSILNNGFQNTEGERGGFMGSVHTVQNQGMFLTDDRNLAHYFGENRADGRWDTEVIECYVDVSRILDTNQAPQEVIKLGLKLINDYNGTKNSRIPKREWWWLMDQPEFITSIKELGYTGVKFRESPSILSVSKSSGNTFLIFDPSTIVLKEELLFGLRDFMAWVNSNQDFVTSICTISQR